MKLALLWSGGKDSAFAACECVANGHEIVTLVCLAPALVNGCRPDEVDSFMFQSVGTNLAESMASAMGLPLSSGDISGTAVCRDLNYRQVLGDEVEELYEVLSRVKRRYPQIEGVGSGAILSEYQRNRVENVCQRLDLQSVAFLWRRDQAELMKDMIVAGIDAIIIKIACFGLTVETDLGSSIRENAGRLFQLSKRTDCGLNICGEGGEYETATFDCPLFRYRLLPTNSPLKVILSDSLLSTVAHLRYTEVTLKAKLDSEVKSSREQLESICGWLDVGSGLEWRRPFASLQSRLFDLPQNLPAEVLSSLRPHRKLTSPTPDWSGSKLPGFVTSRGGLHFTRLCLGSSSNSQLEALNSALSDLSSILDSAQLGFADVIFYLLVANTDSFSDRSEFSALNRTLADAFDRPQYSQLAPTCVYIASDWPNAFLKEEASFLIGLVVVAESRSSSQLAVREGFRVRSLSHWTPAAIGPHSQAVRHRFEPPFDSQSVTFFSPALGLLPETSELASSPQPDTELLLSFRHCHRLLVAMEDDNWHAFTLLVVYATSQSLLSAGRDLFHAMICVRLRVAVECFCELRLVCIRVSGLPSSASVQWQLISSSSADQDYRSVLPEQSQSSSPWLFVSSRCHLERSQTGQAIIPVSGFLDCKLTYVGVSIF